MSELVKPVAGAEQEVIKMYGKCVVVRNYKMPNGNTEKFLLLLAPGVTPAIGMPVTESRHVVIVRQFRYGLNDFVYEFPGGCPKDGQSPEDAFRNEVDEEIGYGCGEVHRLGNPIPFEPASLGVSYVPFLATGCAWRHPPHLDPTEILEVVELPLDSFVASIFSGEMLVDSKTLAVTLLALPHLGYTFMRK